MITNNKHINELFDKIEAIKEEKKLFEEQAHALMLMSRKKFSIASECEKKIWKLFSQIVNEDSDYSEKY